MDKTNKPKKKHQRILQYSEESMQEAIKAVKNGQSVSKSSKDFKVPRITLLYKVKGKYPEGRKMGPSTFLSLEEENALVTWVLHCSKHGFPINKEQLIDSVQMIVTRTGKKTPFPNGRPGRHWYEAFLRRHPAISERVCQNLTTSRANVTEKNIKGWFAEIESYLKTNNYLDITQNPACVFNTDETAFFLNPKGPKVLAQKGEKSIYSKSGDDKECLTTLITGNANGDLAPPMIVFSYERIPSYISSSIPETWGIGKSESGWMTGETFYMYITNIFYPWIKEKGIPLPVVLFVDGHSSHLTLPLSEFCGENGIILIALYPNATHILQPMDVAVFHALKNNWKKEIWKWKIQTGEHQVKKQHFAPILQNVLNKTITKDILKNGFRICGLQPFDKEAVDYKKCLETASETGRSMPAAERSEIIIETNVSFQIQLDEAIGLEKVKVFKQSGRTWKGPVEETSLFYLWLKMNNSQTENYCDSEDNFPVIPGTVEDNVEYSVNTDGDYTIEAEWLDEILNTPDMNEQGIGKFLIEKAALENVSELETVCLEPDVETLSNSVKDPNDDIYDFVKSLISHIMETALNTAMIHLDAYNKSPENTNIPENVPSPFKKLLFWPQPSTSKKKKNTKVRLPPVASSEQWQQYHIREAERKERVEKEKTERKMKRQQKQQEKEQQQKEKPSKKKPKGVAKNTTAILENKKKVTEKETEVEDEVDGEGLRSEEMQPEEGICFEVGRFVIVRYEDNHYPGKIEKIDEEELYINVMEKSGVNWKWPKKLDKLWYNKEDVVKGIKHLTPVNKRGIYNISEMKCFQEFIQ